jgi:hypothetical protein
VRRVKAGEIVLIAKGYVDFAHLRDLDARGVFWVTRAKDNMVYDVLQPMPQSKDEKIFRDEIFRLSHPKRSIGSCSSLQQQSCQLCECFV